MVMMIDEPTMRIPAAAQLQTAGGAVAVDAVSSDNVDDDERNNENRLQQQRQLLLAKINVLLSKPNDNEMQLVALILLTRVVADEEGSITTIATAYRSCIEKLVPFMEWLLRPQQPPRPTSATTARLLLFRLVAQHLRYCAELGDTTTVLMNRIGGIIIGTIEKQNGGNAASSRMIRDRDVLVALQSWLMKCRKSSLVEQALLVLYEASISIVDDDDSATAQQLEPKDDDEEDDEQVLFETTLTKLLDQTSSTTAAALPTTTTAGSNSSSIGDTGDAALPRQGHHDDDDDDDDDPGWIDRLADILTRAGCRMAPLRLPSFVAPMLEYWTKTTTAQQRRNQKSQKFHQQQQITFAKVLLNVIMRADKNSTKLSPLPPDQLTDLILASVVTTHADDALRDLGWSAVVALTAASAGQDAASSWSWCSTARIPVLIRILAGEWRIQLQQQQQQQHIRNSNGPNNNNNRLDESCGLALISAVRYMAALADDDETDLPLSIDQIMHVRRSFNESFQTAVEYMVLGGGDAVDESEDNHKRQHAQQQEQDRIVMRVLGTIMAEMDPFEQQNVRFGTQHAVDVSPKDHDDGDCSDEAPWSTALAAACEKADDGVTLEMLVPALAAVLALSSGNDGRVNLLRQSGLLGTTFTDFMSRLFRHTGSAADTSPESVELACDTIETWLSLSPMVCETATLQSAMVVFLDRVMKERSHGEAAAGCIGPVLAVYASLQGSTPPDDEPSISILQMALHICVSCDNVPIVR
jgi:hypothetical protein